MEYFILLTLSLLLFIGGVIGVGVGIHTKDSFFIVIGALLLVASALAYFQSKEIKQDPFLWVKLFNFFQTITTYFDLFIINRVIDLSRTV